MGCNCKKIYAERDIIGQGKHYTRHICHMTYEGLHDKSEIAAELAHRDEKLDAAEREVDALWKYASHRNDAEVFCDELKSSANQCTCGLDALLNEQEQTK